MITKLLNKDTLPSSLLTETYFETARGGHAVLRHCEILYFSSSVVYAHLTLPRLLAEWLEAFRGDWVPNSQISSCALGWGLGCSGLSYKIMQLISKGNHWAALVELLLERSKHPQKIAPSTLLFFTGWVSFRSLSILCRPLAGEHEANGAFLTTADEKAHCP